MVRHHGRKGFPAGYRCAGYRFEGEGEVAGVFRGAAAAGLSITLSLAAVSALAGTASAANTPGSPTTGGHTTSGHTASGHSAGGHTTSSGPLPTATSQCNPTPTYKPETGVPWAQKALNYQSVWSFTKGAGIKVAVIDSGVDANPQLNGRVQAGQTFVSAASGPASGDCAGHGTLVAGIIGAVPAAGTGFAGVAPAAGILSFKVSGQTPDDKSVNTLNLAEAISQAVQDGAKVINVSIASTRNDPILQDVVETAVHRDVIIVASAGNDEVSQSTGQVQHGPFYPADYPGVLSVGAVSQDGSLAPFSDRKTNVSVTAPGADITSTYPGASGDSYGAEDGTSFAAPFVSGLAALLWSRYPALKATQVVQRIEETASGPAGLGTGNGLINPVQAITAVEPPGPAPAQAAGPGAVKVDRAPANLSEKVVAMSLAGGALVIAVVVIAAAVVIPAGRRRRWRPGEG